jgi:hypothetical protein
MFGKKCSICKKSVGGIFGNKNCGTDSLPLCMRCHKEKTGAKNNNERLVKTNSSTPKPIDPFRAEKPPFIPSELLENISSEQKSKLLKYFERTPNINQAFVCASDERDYDILKILLLASPDVNSTNEYGQTALCTAASRGEHSIVKLLLAAGADPNIPNNNRYTALMAAAEGDYPEIAKMLIEAKANVNWNSDRLSPLFHAINTQNNKKTMQSEVAVMLLEAGADINALLQLAQQYKYDWLTELIRDKYSQYTEHQLTSKNMAPSHFRVGSEPSKIATIVNSFYPNWSHDGLRICFMRYFDYGIRKIYKCNADGSNVIEIGLGNDPSWSPDSKKIVFDWSENHLTESFNTHIYTMNSDGTNRELLAKTVHSYNDPCFSYDGAHILFSKGTSAIFSLDIEKKESVQIIGDACMPACSPKEPKVAFVRKGMVFVANADGSNIVKIAKGLVPKWTPDGKSILYYDNIDNVDNIFIVGCDGKNKRLLIKNGHHPACSPIEPLIAYMQDKDIHISKIAL